MTNAPQLTYRNGRTELYTGNELRAYVEDDTLFAIGHDGYAVRVCDIEHRREIIEKWQNWLNASKR